MRQKPADYQKRVVDLLRLADQTFESFKGLSRNLPYRQNFQQLRSSGLVLLEEMFGDSSAFYRDFEKNVAGEPDFNKIKRVIGVLTAVSSELAILQETPEMDTNSFLIQAHAALQLGNKDLAAIMIGTALEERLEQLCAAHGIELRGPAGGYVGAEQRNMALLRQGAYNRTKQKQVTAWLSLRNSAAHGKFAEYSSANVSLMYDGVREFLAAHPAPAIASTEPPTPVPTVPAVTPVQPVPAATAWPTPSPEAQAKTLKNMRKRLRQIKEILAAEDITEAKKLKKIRFVVNLLLPDKEQNDIQKAPA